MIVKGVAATYIDQCRLGAVTKVSMTPVHAAELLQHSNRDFLDWMGGSELPAQVL